MVTDRTVMNGTRDEWVESQRGRGLGNALGTDKYLPSLLASLLAVIHAFDKPAIRYIRLRKMSRKYSISAERPVRQTLKLILPFWFHIFRFASF